MLSILQREMRINSRAKATFRLRVIISVVALFIGWLLVLTSSPGTPAGASVFSTATFVAFWFCLLQGVRRAASSISDEKREGTLGLLFLTDLRSIDIVLGKLFSIAVPMVQPLFAFVPVLMISVLLGGVTSGEIFRAATTMGTVLLLSIAFGLFISSCARPSTDTGVSTVLLLLAWVILPIVLGLGPLHFVQYFSPYTAFSKIPDAGYMYTAREFFWSIVVMCATAGAALFAASAYLPYRWHEETARDQNQKTRPALPAANIRRAAILDRNPGEWLALRSSGSALQFWIFRIIIIALAFAGVFPSIGGAFLFLAIALFVLRLASQSSYALANARRSGAIELLLSTPLSPHVIITGQVAALRKQFLPEFLAILIASTLAGGEFAFNLTAISLVFALPFAVVATGMKAGLREKTPNRAFFKTLAITMATPIIAMFLTAVIGLLSIAGGSSPTLLFAMMPTIGYLVVGAAAAGDLRGAALERLITPDKERLLPPRPPEWPPRIVLPRV